MVDLSTLDFSFCSSFSTRCYKLLATVPKGRVVSYGDLAKALNSAPRAVGRAMNVNPFAPVIPCHRVVSSDGSLGGFAYGCKEKIARLAAEGVTVKDGKIVDFALKRWKLVSL